MAKRKEKDAMLRARIWIKDMTLKQWIEQNVNGCLDEDIAKLQAELTKLRQIND